MDSAKMKNFEMILKHLDALICCAALDNDAQRLINLNTVKIIQLKDYVEFLKNEVES